MNFYCALDLGTTGCRTIVFDEKGKEISRHYEEWDSYFPTPVMVEQDANHWWNALKTTIKVALKKGRIRPKNIKSVAITNQRETIVPVDKEGNPLHNAIVWQDRRTNEECDFIREHVGVDTIYEKTGLTIDPYFSSSKIMWIKNHKPEIYQNTYKFMLVHDFIAMKLTGKWMTDYSNASRTMLFNIKDLKWDEEIASKLEIDLDKMPDAVASGTQIGPITTKETLFDTSTIVVAGGGDQQCAALGVGVSQPGRTKCTTGTGSFILGYLDSPKFDPNKRVLCSCHTVPGAWVQEASIFTTGSAYRWARDVMCAGEVADAKKQNIDPYHIMNKLAAESPVGSKGLLFVPHMVGAGAPHWNPNARGVFLGLALGHERKDLLRAIMEGVAYEVRKNIEVFNELGSKISELRVTGGGSRSNVWNQIMADVLNIPCGRGELEESTAVGAAILASYGVGDYKNIVDAAENIAVMSKKWTPEPEAVEKYEKLYKLTKTLYSRIADSRIWEDLL
ncbi:MAG: xylulokinase [Promethearchaeota archaeon]|nr:MAG: xylulokinase [Candidatus Lokiarchaeota archaeon]